MWPLRFSVRTSLIIFAVLLLTFLTSLPRHQAISDSIIREILQANMPVGTPINRTLNVSALNANNLTTLYREQLPQARPPPAQYPHLAPFLECPQSSRFNNSHTLLPYRHLNISTHLPETTPEPLPAYFNPTLLPLPSYITPLTPARYLLVTRLVTSGTHQESHYCLATFCHPSSPSSSNNDTTYPPPPAQPCSTSSDSTLNPHDALQCLHPPKPLNISPTPSLNCTDAWSAFPNIPGFHDPRIMWSARGEPLIILNSGSQYGCVGLWVLDLRIVVPELAALMARRSPESVDSGYAKRAGGRKGLTTREWKLPVVRYGTLTELTRWEGRAAVEKNWMLWWTRGGGVLVSYEMFGQWEELTNNDDSSAGEESSRNEEGTTRVTAQSDLEHTGQRDKQEEPQLPLETPLLPSKQPLWPLLNSTEPPPLGTPDNTARNGTGVPAQQLGTSLDNTNPLNNTSTTTTNLTNPPKPIKRSPSPHPDSNTFSTSTSNTELYRLTKPPSVAHLFGSGFASPPLQVSSTHDDIDPCFTPSHAFDPNGQVGKWHQSTPALHLILCRRPGTTTTNTLSSPRSVGVEGIEVCHGGEFEEQEKGVMMTVVHRKFKGWLGLVGRYERFVVVFDRESGRVLGVGRREVVFEGETENVRERGGFVYTTSLAWGWRVGGGEVDGEVVGDDWRDSEEGDVRHLSRLGTGYLGDEVVLGIGIDDQWQAVVRVPVEELLGCLRLCPGVSVD